MSGVRAPAGKLGHRTGRKYRRWVVDAGVLHMCPSMMMVQDVMFTVDHLQMREGGIKTCAY